MPDFTNILVSSFVILPGRYIFLSDFISLNAFSLIVVMPSGSTTSSRPDDKNAPSPISLRFIFFRKSNLH